MMFFFSYYAQIISTLMKNNKLQTLCVVVIIGQQGELVV